MQAWQPELDGARYNFVLIKYAIGYLNDGELTHLLKTLGRCLVSGTGTEGQNERPGYIAVLDQFDDDYAGHTEVDGQTVRSYDQLTLVAT